MAVVVALRKVVDEIDALMDESTAYLNRKTGELYTLQREEAELAEDDVDVEELEDWERDQIPAIRDILGSEDWIPLPSKFDIHEWAIMDQFSRSIDDAELRDELQDAIRGAGAFRNFKSTIHRRGIHEDWYRYRTSALDRIVVNWLDEHEIAHTRDENATSAG